MIRSSVLPNGIRVITKKMEGTRTAALQIHVEAGAWDTDDDNEGVAHFLEHMMFKEADGLNGTELSRRLNELGVSQNAWTWFAETVYHISGIAGDDFYKAGELFCKMVSSTKWTKKELDTEKSIILEEINRYKDNTFYVLCEEHARHLHGKNHPFARTELGSAEQIKATTGKKLREFHSKFYTTGNCLVVASGDVCHEQILDIVATSLNLPYGTKNERSIVESYVNENRFDLDHDCEQAYVSIGVPLKVKATPKNKIIAEIAADVLGGSMGSRLFEYVREELGLAYAVHADASNERGRLCFAIMCGTSHDKIDEAADAIMLITSQMLEEGITEEELTLGRLDILKNLVYTDESSVGMSNRIRITTIHNGDPMELSKLEDIVRSVTLDDVNKFLKRIRPKFLIGTISRKVDPSGE